MKINAKAVVVSLLISIIAFIAIYWGSQRLLRVTYVDIPINGLDKDLDGLKILQISDLHSNNPEKMNLNIWNKIDTLEFDIVAVTGDIVDKSAYQIEPHLESIKNLASKKPVYFAEGNHDHYSMKKLRPYLEDAGITVLVNEKTNFTYNGKTIEIVGLDDFYTADFDASQAMFKKTDKLRIALIHQPQHIDFVESNVSPCIVLSGHTHGGQIRLPLFPTLYAPYQGFFPKYGYGLYDVDGTSLFVSKGIGYTGKAPLRFWNRPEICILTLKAV